MSLRVGWFDALAGASGDMLLGAVHGAGVPLEALQEPLDLLDLGIVLRRADVERGGIGAIKVDADVPETRTLRHLPEILRLFEALPASVAERAGQAFERLARAEAAVHRTSIDEVHFHEVGALDSIADVVGACAGLEHLALDEIHCSTLSLGSGHARGAHGPLPVPVPAVLELTRGGVPVQAGPAPYESTTPTGAAVLVTSVEQWGSMPPMTIEAIGMGAGSKDTDVVANVLRLVVGHSDR
ncbi:MAG: LarC family nickel insertion protein [Actinomycetota bacterium]